MNMCSSCSAPRDETDTFCKKCGVNFQALNNYQAGSVRKGFQIDQYFKWFFSTIRKPDELVSVDKSFGFISMGIQALLMSLVVFALGDEFLKSFIYIFNSFFNQNESYFDIHGGFSLFSGLLVISIIYFGIYMITGWLCKKLFVNQEITIDSYVNQLASYSNVAIVIEIALIILIMASRPVVHGDTLSYKAVFKFFKNLVFFVILLSNYWNIAFIASIVIEKGKSIRDRMYGAIIGVMVSGSAVYLLMKIVLNMTKKSLD
ncbi:zinc ribbon domain-containing protein [Companilactobacillus versmoldensis]|uniref:zinc ribbon domain-containing protein n=1 Tax=Companilactobacillus versmoldensis TaxID=194326 RepID=UPI000249265C|nr:zinc ribbon domain-containing protein [Companilactobacillus versmoldensis]